MTFYSYIYLYIMINYYFYSILVYYIRPLWYPFLRITKLRSHSIEIKVSIHLVYSDLPFHRLLFLFLFIYI